MNFTAIEDALFAWVQTASGLPASKVMWSRQKAPQPEAPYLEMRLSSIQQFGLDWLDTEDAAVPAPEAELDFHSRGTRSAVLTLRCFSVDGIGSSSAEAILEAIRAAVVLPSIADALNTALVGVGSFGDIQSLDGIINSTLLEPRSSMTVTLFLAQQVTEQGTYIETYELDPTITP
jgi:hypothetical protein